jgi:hypothetical protein
MPKRVQSIRPPPDDSRPKNKLLARLPREDYQHLRPHLRTVPVKVKQVLHLLNEPVREVIFLNGGVASMTAVIAAWRIPPAPAFSVRRSLRQPCRKPASMCHALPHCCSPWPS